MKIISLFLMLFSTQLWAHGEDKPGPHGGFIRMPGAFHTEVIAKAKGFEIRLLDIQFNSLSTQHASLKAMIITNQSKYPLSCKPLPDYFFCTASPALMQQTGTLQLLATPDKIPGATVNYTLPLKLSNKL